MRFAATSPGHLGVGACGARRRAARILVRSARTARYVQPLRAPAAALEANERKACGAGRVTRLTTGVVGAHLHVPVVGRIAPLALPSSGIERRWLALLQTIHLCPRRWLHIRIRWLQICLRTLNVDAEFNARI